MRKPRGVVSQVDPEGPAHAAGIREGFALVEADGNVLHDVLDWRWWADGEQVQVAGEDDCGKPFKAMIHREPGQDWGLEFADPLFDGTMACCNDCTFCFMKMLPHDARPSLKERDDDYRLSFIQGNFVTFTNLAEAHERRIVEQRLSPLRFSLHASDAATRRRMIGPRACHGLAVAERLLDAGIVLHAQVVLVPGENDGPVLAETLEWAWQHPGIANVGIVPVGYTRHQSTYGHGFDTAPQAREVLACIEPFRQRAMRERGHAWAYASDELYRTAFGDDVLSHLPDASSYGDFELYEDGIGMIRMFVDEWVQSLEAQQRLACQLTTKRQCVLALSGEATRCFVDPLVAASPLDGLLVPVHVRNDYFGGNVNVTGLLCGCDMARAIRKHLAASPLSVAFAAVPSSAFNAQGVTLDGMTVPQLSEEAGIAVHVVSCQPVQQLDDLASLLRRIDGTEGGLIDA